MKKGNGLFFGVILIIAIVLSIIPFFQNCVFSGTENQGLRNCYSKQLSQKIVDVLFFWTNNKAEKIQEKVNNRIETLKQTLPNSNTGNGYTGSTQ